MNKIFIVAALALTLAGCQSSGPNQTIGTGVGAVGGYGVARAMGAGPAGSAVGAVAGALVGSSVGQSMDTQSQYPQQRPVVVEERYVAVPPPRRQRDCFSTWDRTPRGLVERIVCR